MVGHKLQACRVMARSHPLSYLGLARLSFKGFPAIAHIRLSICRLQQACGMSCNFSEAPSMHMLTCSAGMCTALLRPSTHDLRPRCACGGGCLLALCPPHPEADAPLPWLSAQAEADEWLVVRSPLQSLQPQPCWQAQPASCAPVSPACAASLKLG
jgi:hypothetical protein